MNNMKRIVYSTLLVVLISLTGFSQATLPASWSFPNATLPAFWTESGTAYYGASGNTPPAMKFDSSGDFLVIHFGSTPGNLTYYLAGNGFADGTFTVEESDLGTTWTTLQAFTAPPAGTYAQFTNTPLSTTRYIRFIYTTKVSGNIGLDDVVIAAGAATPEQEINVKQSGATYLSGSTYSPVSPVGTLTPITFTIENLGTTNSLSLTNAFITGPAAADFSVGAYPMTIGAASTGDLIIDFTPSVAGTRNAILTIASNDVDEANYVINLYGIGGSLATEPVNSPTNLTFSNVKSYRLKGQFTASSDAEGYIVLRKKGSVITGMPADGVVYQRGDIVGDAQVVYAGNITSYWPNNIIAGTDYHFAVYPYNGTSTYINYKTTTPLVGVATTPATMVSPTEYAAISTASPTFVSALHALVNPHSMQFYSNYPTLMVQAFASRDTTLNRRVITCAYSGENKIYTEPFDFTANGFSREHTFAHSWMPTNPAQNLPEYNDYHHLFPVNQDEANALRSNYPLGVVVTPTVTYLGCKLGQDANGKTVFEPRNEHKGDAARAMMYECIAYTTVSGNSWSLPSIISSSIPYGQDQDILKIWNQQDAPDNYEIARNDYLDSLQGNRNPFVDNPNYACFIDFSNMTYHAEGCNLGVEENVADNVTVFPVPAKDHVMVSSPEAVIVSYTVTDVQGRIIDRADVKGNSIKLNTSSFKTGTYFINLSTEKGKVLKQIIIE